MSIKKKILFFFQNMTNYFLIYKIYEKLLLNEIKQLKKPDHIGIILDGNRRWGYIHSIPEWSSHFFGAEKVEEFLRWSVELGIKTITLYAFSTENFKRPKKEVETILLLIKDRLIKILSDDVIQKNKVRVKILGKIELLPNDIQVIINKIESITKKYDKFYLNIAIAYGGRTEIIDATKKIILEVENKKLKIDEINEKLFEKYLYTSHLPKSEPDLIIRTSREERLSGFLLWQCAYSELCFIDVFWPDFRKIDLLRTIRTYQKRKRRYGI